MAGGVVLALVLPAALMIAVPLYDGTIRSEADLKSLIPTGRMILGTVPPIISDSDLRRARLLSVQTALISLLACVALIAFLIKVRPIL
jgi:hypothetical protein